MGNQNCTEIYEHHQENQAYGEFQIIKQQNKTIALIQKSLQNDKELIQQVISKLQIRLKLKSPHLVKLQKYQVNQNRFSTHVRMFYDFINRTLEDRFKQIFFSKQQENQQFSQRQLFNILYGVQSALIELDKHQIRHGCINLSTILCQGNFYKITDVSSTTFVKSYDLVRRGCRNQYLSPKLLTNLQYRSLQPFYDLQDDFFSLGMIILTLTSKVQASHFYLWKQKAQTAQLKCQNIQESLKILQRTYSSKLSRKVKQLLNYQNVEQKSVQTTSTTLNNLNTLSQNQLHNQHTQINQIGESVHILNNDIDRILEKVNVLHGSRHINNGLIN